MKTFETTNFVQIVQHKIVRGAECLRNRLPRLKDEFAKDVQDLGIDLVEASPPGAMLVTEIFPALSYFSLPESNSSQYICFVFQMWLQFCQDFVGVHVLLDQKFNDNSLLQLNFHER
jgi:hypothetical protein